MYLNEARSTKILLEIYNALYKASIPSVSFDKLIETGEAKEEGFFMNYEIDNKVYENIVERVIKKYKRLTAYDKQRIRTTIALGSSPRTINI